MAECVVNGRPILVTDNLRHLSGPSRELGFRLLRPEEFIELLKEENP